MRERDAEIFKRRGAIGRIRRTLRKRKGVAPARNRPQHGVDESTRTPFPDPPGQIDGIVYDGGGRHAREMQQLICAEPQDLDDFRVEPGDGAPRELDDQVVESCAPALDAAGDFRGERAVAIVVQAPARAIAVGRSALPAETAHRISYAATRAGAIMAGP